MKYNNILETIGNTALVRINAIEPRDRAEIYAKFEATNPSGSIKDRMAIYMLEAAEKRGKLKSGSTIIEATTGNTGIAFAMAAMVKGYKMLAVMPENMSRERRLMMGAYGARIVLTSAHLGPKGAIAKRDALHSEIKDSWIPGQFDNIDNVKAHELGTGVEILRDMKGNIDAFVAGVGTGGTLIGIANALKKVNPKTIIVAVEPTELAVLSGVTQGTHDIQGIGEGFIPKLVNTKIIDQVEQVSTEEAKSMAKQIVTKEGMFVGTSSGANLVAAIRVAQKLGRVNTVVTIFPDRGERYLSSYETGN
jgi:cysteine synthase